MELKRDDISGFADACLYQRQVTKVVFRLADLLTVEL